MKSAKLCDLCVIERGAELFDVNSLTSDSIGSVGSTTCVMWIDIYRSCYDWHVVLMGGMLVTVHHTDIAEVR